MYDYSDLNLIHAISSSVTHNRESASCSLVRGTSGDGSEISGERLDTFLLFLETLATGRAAGRVGAFLRVLFLVFGPPLLAILGCEQKDEKSRSTRSGFKLNARGHLYLV